MSTKYAIVQILGRQYRVTEGADVKVNLLAGEPGAAVTFDEVLLVNSGADVKVGAPLLKGAKVTATITKHARDRKVLVFKYLRKNKLKKMQGHRQPYTYLKVTGIEG